MYASSVNLITGGFKRSLLDYAWVILMFDSV